MNDCLGGMAELISILNNSNFTLESNDEIIKIKLNESDAQAKLKAAMESLGYLSKQDDVENDFYYVSLYDTDRWNNGESPFVENIEKLYFDARHSLKLREVFYVVNEKLSSADLVDHESVLRIKLFISWVSILKKVADHCHSLGSVQEFIYFLNTDKQAKKYSIKIDAEFHDFKDILDIDSLSKVAKDLSAFLEMEDAHITERRNVMRAALSIILDEVKDGQNALVYLISQGVRFFKKYQEQYEIYTQQFSVNKLLKEIEEKNLEFSGKVNDYISSSQAKALTMPGALIAIGAILKSSQSVEYLLILLGLFLIERMIVTANDIQMESFDNLKKQINRVMGKYQKITQEAEVRTAAEISLQEVGGLIGRAEARLKTISGWARWMFWGGGTYILYKALPWSEIYQFILKFDIEKYLVMNC